MPEELSWNKRDKDDGVSYEKKMGNKKDLK